MIFVTLCFVTFQFAPCIREKVRDCPTQLQTAYESFILRVQQTQRNFIVSPHIVGSLCNIVEDECSDPSSMVGISSNVG